MYYRSVNRGVAFTKPGRYMVGLVLVLGLVALGSGYNGFYLSLSMGLATVIVSGILSERVMKSYDLESLGDVTAEERTPFSIRLTVKNNSRSVAIYGVDNLIAPGKATFRFRWFLRLPPAPISATVLSLASSEETSVVGSCSGLPRGRFEHFTVQSRTLYPFGLLAKFKLTEMKARVEVLPAFDALLAVELRRELLHRLASRQHEHQFHSHRPFIARDALRHIDWRKSAGRESAQWLVKIYESPSDDIGVLVESPGESLRAVPNAESYERHLSRLRTACEVARESGKRVMLDVGGHRRIGAAAAVSFLAALPSFEARHQPLSGAPTVGRAGGFYLRLSFDPSTGQHSWHEVPVYLDAGAEAA
jgi:uncharacterized protein (DUF58 family)